MFDELGRTSYITRRYFIIVKYWFKILTAEDNKYIKIVYDMMLRDSELLPDKVNWVSLLRHLLMSLGFYEVWLNQGVGDCNRFLMTLKQRLTDNFIQNWRSRLDSSTRAIFYKHIAVFQLQPYLDLINVQKFSQILSRLRMSSHRLEIEAGRWVKPNSIPVDDRKCAICLILEDEYHFVLECEIYKDLSSKYIAPY